mmetsp:Transcript_16185/g.35147  ORF Transcript_16185/g.35147 Transcript_16185/m.35147 type:complete len:287 (-) Transcript_16185:278-1138(-)
MASRPSSNRYSTSSSVAHILSFSSSSSSGSSSISFSFSVEAAATAPFSLLILAFASATFLFTTVARRCCADVSVNGQTDPSSTSVELAIPLKRPVRSRNFPSISPTKANRSDSRATSSVSTAEAASAAAEQSSPPLPPLPAPSSFRHPAGTSRDRNAGSHTLTDATALFGRVLSSPSCVVVLEVSSPRAARMALPKSATIASLSRTRLADDDRPPPSAEVSVVPSSSPSVTSNASCSNCAIKLTNVVLSLSSSQSLYDVDLLPRPVFLASSLPLPIISLRPASTVS